MVRSLARGRRHLSGLSFATWEKAQQAPATLNLAIGQPASSLLPMEAVQRAASALSSFDRRHVLQYGSIAGSHHYLDAVASFLTAELDEPHDASSLFATPGNSGGLALLTRVLTEPGDRVFIEDPSYFLAHGIFRDHGLSFVRLPQRATGTGTLDMDLVEQAFAQQAASSAPMPKVLYMVPTGNNPTGRSMPDEDRAHLVGLCGAHGVTIVSDDVYDVLQFGRASSKPRTMRWHAQQQQLDASVVSLGSWSKLLGPGLRLGWIDADSQLRTALAADGEVVSGSLTSALVESLVAHLVTSGDAATHVHQLRASLARRATLLADAIEGEQPAGTPSLVHRATSGYFLWVDLRGLDAAELRERCVQAHGVAFLPGARCALDAAAAQARARVCFAFLEEDELVEAGRRLGRAIAEAHGTA